MKIFVEMSPGGEVKIIGTCPLPHFPAACMEGGSEPWGERTGGAVLQSTLQDSGCK